MIRGLIFDFDGLILETEGPVYQSWQELYAAYGSNLPFEQWAKIIGTHDLLFDAWAELERQLGRPLNRAELETQRREREMALICAQPPLPGVRDYLGDARRLGLKVAVASSSSRGWVSGHLRRLGLLDNFDVIRTREDVARTKPAPELYLAALEALGLSAQEAVAFEDSPNGILAAKAAGIFCVAVPNALTSRLPLDHADLRLASLASLPLHTLLEQINGRL